jgi:3-oxoadipate enol-lactonase
MPRITVNGAALHYEDSGGGPETLVLSHGLLLSHRMFDAQVEAFAGRFRCVRFDFRGQGHSEVTRSGYDVDSLTQDAAALIRSLGCAPCHFLGFSMGGYVGLRLAARHPDLLRSLILVGTSASRERRPFRLHLLRVAARFLGMRTAAPFVFRVQFGPGFREDASRAAIRQAWHERIVAADGLGASRAAGGIVERRDYTETVSRLRVPTLIVVGQADSAQPVPEARKLHGLIAGSELVIVPGAGHAVTIEDPEAVNLAVGKFLDRVSSAGLRSAPAES